MNADEKMQEHDRHFLQMVAEGKTGMELADYAHEIKTECLCHGFGSCS